jgi:hypothetical protein
MPIPNQRLHDFGITETVVGVGIAVAAAAASTAAAVNQAQQQQKAANYNAQVNANNAQVATWQRQQQEQANAAEALATQQQGAQDASRLEMRNGALEARNINAAASGGLAISGSTQDVISGSAANNELEVLNEQHKTALDAWASQAQASNASYNSMIQANRYSAESGLDTAEAGWAQTSGIFNATGAALSGASKTGTALNSLNDAVKQYNSTNNGNDNGLFD